LLRSSLAPTTAFKGSFMKLETDEEEAIRTVARGTDETEANNANENVERPRIKSKWNQAPDNSQTTEDQKTAQKKSR